MKLCLAAVAVCVATAVPCQARSIQLAMGNCVVNDPTPTQLNFRTAPNGKILGKLENGLEVSIIDRASDDEGKPWVYIADYLGKPIGWVYRPYIRCY